MSYFWAVSVVFIACTVFFFERYRVNEDALVSLNATYDYIIIGAGSAGCVLANRLSEDSSSSVLIVEAGGSENKNPLAKIPAFFFSLQNTELDWAFRTVPQKKSCLAMDEERCAWPRGKVLGGTSILNAMSYIRGSRHDYDAWEKEGCTGWSYKDVLPYFIKSEDIRSSHLQNSEYHGKGGLLAVSDGTITDLNMNTYAAAMKELGYNVTDCNGRNQIGFCTTQENIGDGERWDTARGFLRPAMERSNLHVAIKSHVTKVQIENKKATGIEFIRDGIKHKIKAKKEIILSAGAVSSPQILMLSGIGPKAHLQALHIPVNADLPVGDNLQDHLMLTIRFRDQTGSSITQEKATSLLTKLQYQFFGSGVYSKSLSEGIAFFTDSESLPPYSEIHFKSESPGPDAVNTIATTSNLKKKAAQYLEAEINRTHRNKWAYFTLMPVLLHPKSTGTIRLQSINPFDSPVIRPNYLDHPDDVKNWLKGIRKALELSNTHAFNKTGASPDDPREEISYCMEHEYSSDEYWICRMKHFTLTIYHPTSTCRMGAEKDPTAVVDPQLRVKGIQNLRVVDASVMRNIPSGNTNAPTIMIAEKASDLIRGKDTVVNLKKLTDKL